MMLGFGAAVGGAFAIIVFGISVLGMPMLLDRDVDFMTALLTSISQVFAYSVIYMAWGLLIAAATLIAMIPVFLGLFIAMPVFGHASWHFYKRLTVPAAATITVV